MAGAIRNGLILFFLGAFVAGCGGGGGGGGVPINPSVFNTTEFGANYGLASIGALTAYDNSGTGEGVTVAVIDTGIDVANPEFAGALSAASTNTITNNVVDLQDDNGHGTAVAGVIAARKNDVLTHGLAFDSTILAIKADDIPGGRFSDGSLATAINYAVANNADIINMSLSGDRLLSAAYQTAIQDAVNAGVIIVAIAGNEGGSAATQVRLPARLANCSASLNCDALTVINGFNAQGRMIAVGSVDSANNLSSFSNPAGDTASAFLMAPGSGIVTTGVGGGTVIADGTSFAAPHVSAALAIILERFPTLSTQDAVDLLLTTASDLGATGTDTTFGRGLLNLQAAFQAQGVASLPMSRRVSGPRSNLSKTFLQVGASFGDAFFNNAFLGQAIILDSYERPYKVDLRNRITRGAVNNSILSFFVDTNNEMISVPVSKGSSLAFSVQGDSAVDSLSEDFFSNRRGIHKASELGPINFSTAIGKTAKFSIARDVSGLGFFGSRIMEDVFNGLFYGGSWTLSPQLSLLGRGNSLRVVHNIKEEMRVSFGVHQSKGTSSVSSNQRGEGQLAHLHFSHKTHNGLKYGVSTGYVEEENALFRSSSGGAFGATDNNLTHYVSVEATWEISEKTRIFGIYTDLNVKPSLPEDSILGNWSRTYANAFNFGITSDSIITTGDKVGISIGQPLRVRKSEVDITLPIGRNLNGDVFQSTQRVAPVPTGRQIDLQLAYTLKTEIQKSELTAFTRVTLEAGHERSANPEGGVGLRWKKTF